MRDESVGGLMLSVPGTRNIAVTAGTLWSNLNEFPISALDTSVTGTVEAYWYKAGEGWQDSDLTQYSVTQWNDVTQTTLQTIDNNKFCNVWVYAEADDSEISIIYPQAQYNSAAEAQLVGAPSNLPVHIANNGILIGRVVIKQGVDAPVAVQSAFGTAFTASVTSSHSNLTNLSADDHPQYHNDTRGDARYYTQAQITTISGDIVAQIPVDYVTSAELTTASGDIVSQIPSLVGYATEAYVTTVSGDIVAQIPDVSDFITDAEVSTISGDIISQLTTHKSSADHDGRYYTESEVDVISGAINTKLDTHKSSSDHDSRYYTESEVDTISGSINTKLDTHKTSSDHDGRYYTEAEVTTISGDILSYVSTNYIDSSEMATISGNIISRAVLHDYGTGTNNLVGGVGAGAALQSGGNSNVLLGESAGNDLTTGDWNVFVGGAAGAKVITASSNTAVGTAALANGTGTGNTVIGATAITSLTTGDYNTVIGMSTGGLLDNATYNTIIGAEAGSEMLSGSFNIVIGGVAGDTLVTGSRNVIIGRRDINTSSINYDDQLQIENRGAYGLNDIPLIYGNFATDKLGINTTTLTQTLNVGGAILIGTTATTASGTIRFTGTAYEGYVNDGWVSLASTTSGIAALVDDTTPQLGGNLDTNGNDILFGADTISGTGPIYTGDHGAGTTEQVVNVIYGTGDPPVASGVTIGCLYIKYTA